MAKSDEKEDAERRQGERLTDWGIGSLAFSAEGDGVLEDLDPDRPLPPELLKGLKEEAKRLGLSADFVER